MKSNPGFVAPMRTAGANHYLQLPDASVVATEALLVTKENLLSVIDRRAMMCVHGESGLGKTLSVNECLRDVAAEATVRVEFASHPRPRDVRHVLFEALELAGRPPRRPFEFNQLLKQALAQRFRVLVCDEAQWLPRECFELFRYLWDDPGTQVAIVFVGGDDCYRVLRNEPMLASRIFVWQDFQRLSREQVLSIIPVFHPVWRDAEPADILYTDQRAAHGNFRAWANVTLHVLDAMAQLDRPTVDREVLRWAFSKMA